VKVPVSWMREFADVPAAPDRVAAALGACGFAVEGVDADVIDFEVTANRPDCLSVLGLAREAAVAFGVTLQSPITTASGRAATPGEHSSVKVSIGDPGCGRYALALADVKVGPSPAWLAGRLAAAGIRAINNVVDVTNYVMLEMGHPMHAFDAERLAGSEIRVRRARAGETIATLDGVSRALDDTMLIIADRDAAIAVAGVMGGAASEVSSGTTRIAIESAWFSPVSVRATSRKLGLKTEASIRFERGADIGAPVAALERALVLLQQIDAGRAVGSLTDIYPRVSAPHQIELRRDRIARLLGDQIPDADVVRILSALGFGVTPSPGGWRVEVPTFRVDVLREVDLIEEVGRHWGFDRIPATLPAIGRAAPAPRAAAALETRLRTLARAAGLQEAVTFTFLERTAAEPFTTPASPLVAIANPLSEKFAVLRPSILPGLLDALIYNRRRDADAVRLFEVGSVFHADGESQRLGWVMTGPRHEHWSEPRSPLDFYDARGIADLLLAGAGVPVDAVVADATDDVPWYLRGRAAVIRTRHHDAPVGWVGELRADLAAARGLDAGRVVGGEIDLRQLAAQTDADEITRVDPVPRHPAIVRDLSIVVPERLPAATVRGTIRANAPPTLRTIVEFDRYQGKGVPDGHVSLSLRLTFRDADRTLTDDEAQQAVDAIVDALGRAHGATLRGKA
jgi:phenylalanyl-tRNA synthetase beta chain